MSKKRNRIARPPLFDANGKPLARAQSIRDHLLSVLNYIREFTYRWDAEGEALAVAVLHDSGKISILFTKVMKYAYQRILGLPRGDKPEVTHSAQGALIAESLGLPLEVVLAVLFHHGGLKSVTKDLYDRLTEQGKGDYEDCLKGLLKDIPTARGFIYKQFTHLMKQKEFHKVAMRVRMLVSAEIDADWLDAERIRNPCISSLRKSASVKLDPVMLLDKLNKYVESLDVTTATKEVLGIRINFYDLCKKKGKEGKGFFFYTGPTGGGKTLSSAALALTHAIQHKMDRIIYAMPYRNIIHQNADVFRDAFGEGIILEHQSAYELPPGVEGQREKLKTENWDSPFIMTSFVQIIETLFTCKPSRLRKLHRLAYSIIVIDETQNIPAEYMEAIFMALRILVEDYGCTVVFMSATNPSFDQIRSSYTGDFLVPSANYIVKEPEKYFNKMRRVNVHWPKSAEDITKWDDIAKRMDALGQSFCIANTRKQVMTLYEKLMSRNPTGVSYLTSFMVPSHCLEVLKRNEDILKVGGRCLLASTQSIESGSDITFPNGFRAFASFISISQTGGRVNRGGLLKHGNLWVFIPPKGLLEMPPGEYHREAMCTLDVLRAHNWNLDIYDPSIAVKIRHKLYVTGNLDEKLIYEKCGILDFEGAEFNVIEAGKPVYVPYDKEASDLIDVMCAGRASRFTFRKAGRYAISLKYAEITKAKEKGYIDIVDNSVHIWTGNYDKDLGVAPAFI